MLRVALVDFGPGAVLAKVGPIIDELTRYEGRVRSEN